MLRRAASTHRSPAARLALALCAERCGDLPVHGLLGLSEPFVEHTEGDDDEAGEDKGLFARDVPGAEDDAGVFDLGVPGSR